ncbi:MAG: hypothetical protein J5851_05185, partial [Oscillospiraceae bacterium]|nr:hypothetical protein [Oscillospiraceae bacterium]
SNNGVQAYLGYKTTKDKDEAITDLTLLDSKNSHFESMTYEEYLDKHLSEYSDIAAEMMLLVNEFRANYKAGSEDAIAAYDTLNFLYTDNTKSTEDKSNLFGEYLLKEADRTFFEKFMQRGNAQILSFIVNALANATTDCNADGTTWLDRSKTSFVLEDFNSGDSKKRNQYNSLYLDQAKVLTAELQSFAANYTEAVRLREEYGDSFGYDISTDASGEELLEQQDCLIPEYVEALTAYALLDEIEYQAEGEIVVSNAALLDEDADESAYTTVCQERKTLAEYFLELGQDTSLSLQPERLYPFIASMTPGQRVVMKMCSLDHLARSLIRTTNYAATRQDAISDAMQQLSDLGYEGGRIWLWEGVDFSVLSKKAVETGDLIDARNGGKNVMDSANEPERQAGSTLSIGLQIADIVILGTMGLVMIIQAIVGCSLWAAGLAVISAGYTAAVVGTMVLGGLYALGGAMVMIGGFLLCIAYVLNILMFWASLVLFVYMIYQWTKDDRVPTDYSTIPDYIFHLRCNSKGNYRVRYEPVKGNADKSRMEWLWALTFYKLSENGRETAIEALEKGEVPKFNLLGDSYLDYLFSNIRYGEYADLGAYQSNYDRWQILCYSKNPLTGKPIVVPEDRPLFITQQNNYLAPEGYRGITLISGSTSQDINVMEIEGETGAKAGTPLYLFVAGESGTMNSSGDVTDASQYVTKVVVQHADTQEEAVNKLLNASCEVININLTPGSGYTILGYQLGSRAGALTDLRVSGSGMPSIHYGEATYGRADLLGQGVAAQTPYGLSLYSTASLVAGTPIVKVTVENERRPLGSGAEPACLFTGGQAVDFSHNWNDNSGFDFLDWHTYFTDIHWAWTDKNKDFDMAQQDDPVNGVYIYFWPETQFKAQDEEGNANPQYVSGFSYFMTSDKDKSGAHGTGSQFMQTFARENGYELVMKDGAPAKMMSASAGEMKPVYNWTDKEGGAVADHWTYDMYHTYYKGVIMNESDGALGNAGMVSVIDNITQKDKYTWHTETYFGVSYTYNHYRAITGVAGYIAPYTERSSAFGFNGLTTPAKSFISCTTNIQGFPLSAPGVCMGYSSYTRNCIMYLNKDARQKSDLDWMTDQETEVRTHYLLQNGPVTGVLPLLRDDLMFVANANPGSYADYVPITDLRSPGDYEHPLNFALDTSNLGSEYFYIYLKKNAGGRENTKAREAQEAEIAAQYARNGEKDKQAPYLYIKEDDGPHNEYKKKEYVAGVFCGVGKTPEEALSSLYAKAQDAWATIAATHPDISATPCINEFDEILPLDLTDKHAWYDLYCQDLNVSLKDDQWARGNENAERRWGHERIGINALGKLTFEDAADEHEYSDGCAYIGVVRSAYSESAVYAVMKYYRDDNSNGPKTLNVGGTSCTLAGGPVQSPEGQYYLYYSTNSGTASFCAPVTEIDVSEEQFINGYNSCYSCFEKDRVNFQLPPYANLRMRTDEQYYIHTKYNMSDLPYIETICVGVGNNKKEAYADLISTTQASGATDVNCCYNSYSDKWVAIGYRRTKNVASAIRDVFLYVGEDPVNTFIAENAYMLKNGKLMPYKVSEAKRDENGNMIKEGKKPVMETSNGPRYQVLMRAVVTNGKASYVPQPLNEGTGATPIYLYYSVAKSAEYYHDPQDVNSWIAPIRNIAFTYGDTSPKYASAQQLADVYSKTVHGQTIFDPESYANMHWENVLAIDTPSPTEYQINGQNGTPISLSYRAFPEIGNNVWHTSGDKWVRMFVDRGSSESDGCTHREGCELADNGYYAETSRYGVLQQKVN